MAKKKLFVTGMFRSGTTLLGKCLGSHPDITLALDPMVEFFREIRNRIAPKSFLNDTSDPFHHNFWVDSSWKRERYKNVDLRELECDPAELSDIKQKVINCAESFSPAYCERLSRTELQGTNLKSVLDQFLETIQETYGDGDETYTGFKEVWCEEFSPLLLNNYSDFRVVHIVRDPRAVVSSKLSQEDQYPVLFLSRFGRKTIAQTQIIPSFVPEFRDRYKVVKFEHLVGQPETTLNDISEFLDVPFDEAMLQYRLHDPESVYSAGANSSYQNLAGKSGFVSDAIDKWKTNLSDERKEFIEWLTYPEMNLFDYRNSASNHFPGSISEPPEIDEHSLASWQEPYQGEYLASRSKQQHVMLKETVRHQILEFGPEFAREHFSSGLIEKCFSGQEYFDYIREAVESEDSDRNDD